MNSVVIAGYKRTPIGAFQGVLSNIPASELGKTAISAALESAQISGNDVDEVIMGNVLSAGLGQAPARQAALYAGLPDSVECLTINKMCGSGLKAVMLGTQAIQTGDAEVIVAGGMENMSLAPYLVLKGRSGFRLGHQKLQDSVILDGLWDVYNDKHMGNCAELCAAKYKFSRDDQDTFARESYTRAQNSKNNGIFKQEIVGVEIENRKGNRSIIAEDEEPQKANFDKMTTLKPAFEKNGTVTAANASKINDGAAALVLMSKKKADELGVNFEFTIVAQASAAQDPEWFTTAPVKAVQHVLQKAELTKSDIDLFEINEAFSTVVLSVMKELDLSYNKVNIYGGAVALGHPIGASGARILVTLLNAMKIRDAKHGCATICIAGGEASAVIIERN